MKFSMDLVIGKLSKYQPGEEAINDFSNKCSSLPQGIICYIYPEEDHSIKVLVIV